MCTGYLARVARPPPSAAKDASRAAPPLFLLSPRAVRFMYMLRDVAPPPARGHGKRETLVGGYLGSRRKAQRLFLEAALAGAFLAFLAGLILSPKPAASSATSASDWPTYPLVSSAGTARAASECMK